MLWKEGEQSGSHTRLLTEEDIRMQQKNRIDELDCRQGGHEIGQSAETQDFAGWVSMYLHLRRDLLSPFKLLSVKHFLSSVYVDTPSACWLCHNET